MSVTTFARTAVSLFAALALSLVALPYAVAQPEPAVTVTLTGPTVVDLNTVPQAAGCSWRPGSNAMTDQGGNRFLITPEDYLLGVDSLLLYGQCEDGRDDVLAVGLNVPFVIKTPPVISPSESYGIVSNIWVSSKEPATAQVLRNGKVVNTTKVPAGGGVVDSPITAKNASGDWRVRVSSAGQVGERKLEVAKGWSLISEEAVHFPRCSTLTWAVKSKGQPARGKGIVKDIEGALARLSKATGLTFVRTRDYQDADLRYFWGKAGGSAGLGGYSYSTDGEGNFRMRGEVELSKSSPWLGVRGFSSGPGKTAGRGALLLHETMHALGLGHVDDSKQIMAPVSRPGSPAELGKGDKAGLAWLYAPKSCKG